MECKFLYTIELTKDMYGNQKVIAMFETLFGIRLLWSTTLNSKALKAMKIGETYNLKWTEVAKLSENDYKVERVHII